MKNAIITLIEAYNEGLIPSGLYYPGKKDVPMMEARPLNRFGDKETHFPLEADMSMHEFIETLKLYKNVFNSDGSFNNRSNIAETYAISLALDGKYDPAVRLFDSITSNGKFQIPCNTTIPPVVNHYGKLGYEGANQYANACMELENSDHAKIIYGVIADVHRKCCTPETRFSEIRLNALETLVSLGMSGYEPELLLARKSR